MFCSNFSRRHATLHLAVSVGRSVCPSVRHIFEFRAVFALLLLPNCPRLDFRVSGLVICVFLWYREFTYICSQFLTTSDSNMRNCGLHNWLALELQSNLLMDILSFSVSFFVTKVAKIVKKIIFITSI